ncbi:MAG: hypothetical protein M9962_06310, partial [Oligoflexia bacterium]|nr:hypothetical protein [Oligoflexia bacterium]
MRQYYYRFLLLLFLPVFALAEGTIPSIPKTPAINTSIPACLIHGEKQGQLKQLLDQRRPNHFKHKNNGEVKKFIEKQDSLLSFGIRSLKDLCEEIQKA